MNFSAKDASFSCSPIDTNGSDSIWHNFLVNLSPKTRKNGATNIYTFSQVQQRKQPTRNNLFSVPLSGDISEKDKNRFAEQQNDTIQKWDSSSDCKWYQFDDDYLLEPNVQTNENQLQIHSLSTSRRGMEEQFPKVWGNFTNVFDKDGRQKFVIYRSKLSNYMQLHNIESDTEKESSQAQSITFLASLFTGNYPKPLTQSIWSWRMRWNVFVAGIDEQLLADLDSTCKETIEEKEVTCLSKDSKVLHFGEIHLYLHVERGQELPTYQNLCFFYNSNVVSFIKGSRGKISVAMEDVALKLKNQLSKAEFVAQLYFPVEATRFSAVDQSVQTFELCQQDLQAAIAIVNETVPFSFLQRAPTGS